MATGWNDREVKYLIDLRNNTDLTWKEIREEFIEQFGRARTVESLRKAYKRYQVEDLSQEPADVLVKNMTKAHNASEENKRLRKENKAAIENKVEIDEFLDKLDKKLAKGSFKFHKAAKKATHKVKAKYKIVAHISDTHIGVRIKSDEMGGTNEYNELTGNRRFAMFFDELAKYKLNHRKDTDLILVLNGDIFAGVIHGQEGGVALMTDQFIEALNIFTQGISYVAKEFNKLDIYCITGNHDRYIHKDNKGRQTEQKWDSFGTNLYVSLKNAFREYKNITFHIPKTPYALFKVFDHTYLATHGDTFLNIGNPGAKIDTGNITKQINAISIGLGIKIDAVMVGHVHKATVQVLDNGVILLINGTLSGTDPFAQSLGITGNFAIQCFHEVTEDYAVGDIRIVRLESADQNKELDKIISKCEMLSA